MRSLLILLVAALSGCGEVDIPSPHGTAYAAWISDHLTRPATQSRPANARPAKPVAWRREDQALRDWVDCARSHAGRLALVDRRSAGDLATAALKQCDHQQVRYQHALTQLRIATPIEAIRRSMGDHLTNEILTLRNQGSLNTTMAQPADEASDHAEAAHDALGTSDAGASRGTDSPSSSLN